MPSSSQGTLPAAGQHRAQRAGRDFHAQWHSLMDGKYQREKRRKSAAGNWRLVR